MGNIRFRGLVFDPEGEAAELGKDPAFTMPSAGRAAPSYVIVKRGRLRRSDLRELHGQGTRVLEYLDGGAYLCALSADPAARRIPSGRVLPFAWRLKIDPGFYGSAPAPDRAPPGKLPRFATQLRQGLDPSRMPQVPWKRVIDLSTEEPWNERGNDTPVPVDIVLHRDVGPGTPRWKEILAAIGALPGHAGGIGGSGRRFRAKLPPAALPALAQIDGVYAVSPHKPASVSNDVATRILNVNPPGAGTAWRGRGQVVCVNDLGFDNGRIDDVGVHPAFTERGPNAARRSRMLELLSPPQDDGRARPVVDQGGHATHVCGSVAGDLDCGTVDSSQTPFQLCGTAPEARLVVVNLQGVDGGLDVPAALFDLWHRVHCLYGARVFTNSWNHERDTAPRYGAHALAIDEFAWNHPDAVVLFSAGNAGMRADPVKGTVAAANETVEDPGTSKNAICVGAVESERTVKVTYADLAGMPVTVDGPPEVAQSCNRVAPFSGRGPAFLPSTEEPDAGTRPVGRAKPDLVAPGTAILSIQSQGVSVPCTEFDPPRPDDVRGAYFLSGTSMATPLVAGCVALIREWLGAVHGLSNPPASLVKALLVNGATPLGPTGRVTALPDDLPDEGGGFGRVNVDAVVSATAGCRFFVDTFRDIDEEREIHAESLHPAAQRLKVTLAWTDAPGEALQSDLDLIVVVDGEERHGNCGKWPLFDRANTVEQVDWENPPSGDFRVVVRAHRLAAETLDGTAPQAFHVVVRME